MSAPPAGAADTDAPAAAAETAWRSALAALAWRDLRIAWRQRSDVAVGLVFFVIVTSLFPLGVGSDRELLRQIGPGVVWVAALLANLLALPRLFAADQADGTLEQLLLSPQPLALLVAAKVGAHWIATGAPLVLAAPCVALQYGLGADAIAVLPAALLLGTPTLALLGALGAALTLGLRGGGVLTALLVLPLNAPLLIFGASAVSAPMAGMDAAPLLSLLGALLAFAAAALPWAIAHALRLACE